MNSPLGARKIDALGERPTPTGSGSPVLATSPTLVSPALGTPSAVVLTNGTGLPLTGLLINGATGLTTPDWLLDELGLYDASATANRKITLASSRRSRIKHLYIGEHDYSTVQPIDLAISATGAGAGMSITGGWSGNDTAGVAYTNCGTTTTGRCSLLAAVDLVQFGVNPWYFRMRACVGAALSDATDTYTCRAGFMDSNSAEATDGHYFRYTHGTNSGKYECVSRSNTTETATDSGVTAQIATLDLFEISVSADGLTATFSINGSVVATHVSPTVTMPTGSSRRTTYGIWAIKSAGITNFRGWVVDHHYVEGQFLTART